jgi:CheY-like chemotaxis protein
VWNLLSNAIKFTPKDGKVQAVLRAWAHVEPRRVDTGIGIDRSSCRSCSSASAGRRVDDATLRRARDRLSRSCGNWWSCTADGARQSAVQAAAQASPSPAPHGRVPNSAGRRPSRRRDRRPHRPLTTPATSLDGLTVLVVDDDSDARELVAACSPSRAEVLTAASAAEALPLVERERPDVLVSDIAMPEIDGYELLRQVRALGEGRGGKLPCAVAHAVAARAPTSRTRAASAPVSSATSRSWSARPSWWHWLPGRRRAADWSARPHVKMIGL